MAKTLIEKILAEQVGREVAVGDIIGDLPVDLAWGSEMTLTYAMDILKQFGLLSGENDHHIRAQADKVMFPFDHLIPSRDKESASMMVDLRAFAQKYGIRVFDAGYDGGIQHRLFEERGYLFPGAIGLGADSHSCTYGALSAAATGIGSSDLAAIMLSGKTWLQVPPSIQVRLTGKPKPGTGGKDIILYLLGLLGEDGANYQVLEFSGDGIQHLDMASRFTISNMAVEGGAKMGLFPTDGVTLEYLSNVVARNFPEEIRFDPAAIECFSKFKGDEEAHYSKRITIDLQALEPMVSLPYLPGNALGIHQLDHIIKHPAQFQSDPVIQERLKAIAGKVEADGNIPIQQVFIGSCTNGRIEDLRIAAEIFKGRKVAKTVRVIVIPASQQVFREALQEGLIQTFLEAGCYVESSSCGPCIGFKSGVLGRGETAIYTSNRNFYGRMGDSTSLVLLASPAVAAVSALAGKLASPYGMETYYTSEKELVDSIFRISQAAESMRMERSRAFYQASIKSYLPEAGETGKAAWKFGDNVNTDLIFPARYCNITDPQEYKKHLLADAQNSDFLFHFKRQDYSLSNDVIVGGKNFGCGSSRESAPMAIKVSGVAFVVAHSFARIFYRNAINLGLPVFELGDTANRIQQGDRLRACFETGEIFNITQGEMYQAKPLAEYHRVIHQAGGIIPYICNSKNEASPSLLEV